jgi:hypothetical protein
MSCMQQPLAVPFSTRVLVHHMHQHVQLLTTQALPQGKRQH